MTLARTRQGMQALRALSRFAPETLKATWQFPSRTNTVASALGITLNTEVKDADLRWKQLMEQGLAVNPCGSPQHPAVRAGIVEASDIEASLQESYTPLRKCYGCGAVTLLSLIHI